MRDWYRRPGNATKARESQRRARERAIEAKRTYDRKRGYRSYDAKKEQARRAVSHAVAKGKLLPAPCEVCGNKAQAHHDDYNKPLDVRWLCSRHHGEEHRRVA